MILYKYTDVFTALKLLREKKFRYTQPIAFNDPFEVSPILEQEIGNNFLSENISTIFNTPSNKEYLYNTAFKEMYDKLSVEERETISFDKFKEEVIDEVDTELGKLGTSINEEILTRLMKIKPQYTEYLFRMLPIEIGQSTGVFCLSSKPDDILMWSHYADSHLGIVIEINVENHFFSSLRKINYTLKRPSIDINCDYKNENDKLKYGLNIFFTKSKDWSYECEFRDIKLISTGANSDQKDRLGFPIVLYAFPQEIIKGLIFGSRLTKDSKKEIIRVSKLLDYKIDYKEAVLDKEYYKVNIEPFNPNRNIIS